VIGAFVDGQWSEIKGDYSFNCPTGCLGNPTGQIGQIKNDWSWAAGGRIGYVALPGLLAYVNGGWTEANLKQVNYVDAALGTATGLVRPSERVDGWFIGGGVERSLNIFGITAPGWFMKTEYRAAYYDSKNINELIDGTNLSNGRTIHMDKPLVQTISTSLVYRFNWGGAPVGANY
jgi:outer membrane immunogenic protein